MAWSLLVSEFLVRSNQAKRAVNWEMHLHTWNKAFHFRQNNSTLRCVQLWFSLSAYYYFSLRLGIHFGKLNWQLTGKKRINRSATINLIIFAIDLFGVKMVKMCKPSYHFSSKMFRENSTWMSFLHDDNRIKRFNFRNTVHHAITMLQPSKTIETHALMLDTRCSPKELYCCCLPSPSTQFSICHSIEL